MKNKYKTKRNQLKEINNNTYSQAEIENLKNIKENMFFIILFITTSLFSLIISIYNFFEVGIIKFVIYFFIAIFFAYYLYMLIKSFEGEKNEQQKKDV